jgi:GTP-binding protein Era
MPMREIAAEITREQLFHQLHAELPYALTVEQESWEDFADGSLRIGQQIIVAREGQRAIVLGERGQRIKAVREAAQAEISILTGRKVHLFLHVKFRENWQDDPERYRAMGLEFED